MTNKFDPATEPAPCETCCIATTCRKQRAACVDYWVFVERSAAPRSLRKFSRRYPTPEIHDFLFCGLELMDTGRRDKLGRPIHAEPEEYLRLRRLAFRSLPRRGEA